MEYEDCFSRPVTSKMFHASLTGTGYALLVQYTFTMPKELKTHGQLITLQHHVRTALKKGHSIRAICRKYKIYLVDMELKDRY